MGLLIKVKEAHNNAINAKSKNQAVDQKIADLKKADIKEKLDISKKDKKQVLEMLSDAITEASKKGKQKEVFNEENFCFYTRINRYDLDVSGLKDDCIRIVNDKKRGEKIARSVVKQLTDIHLPLAKRYYLTYDFKLTNIYRLLAYSKQALIEAGYQVEYKPFSRNKALIVRW